MGPAQLAGRRCTRIDSEERRRRGVSPPPLRDRRFFRRAVPMPIDAMPTQVRRARPKARSEWHRQARINAANAGDNWAIRWPAEEVKSLTYWEKQSEQWADRRARL